MPLKGHKMSPEHKANMLAGRKRAEARRRAEAAAAAGADVHATNGHVPSGRAMLVDLARQGAIARRDALRREIEKLDLFLAKTAPAKHAGKA